MLKINDDDILVNTVKYLQSYNSELSVPFTGKKFFEKALPKLSKETGRIYPYQVNIARKVSELLKCNLDPVKVIDIEEPIQGPLGEMWFGDSSSGVRLLAGYKNGDSRYVCDQELGDAEVHGFLAGSTGQGKSVTLNAFIYGICYMYAPWEVSLTLCDPKIVEFKTIALSYPMPQVTTVAATGDADYLISVLGRKVKEMNERNDMFTAVGKHLGCGPIKNIKAFRDRTGLVIPQELIIIDEVQTMIKDAGKKASVIQSQLDSFARLGRSTGFHLLLASQEVGSEISSATLGNIKLRMAMGCFSNVSQKILGNDGAAYNMGKKGYMLLNKDPAVDDNKSLNVLYRVPFCDGDADAIADAAIGKGKELGVNPIMNFYDENDTVDENSYPEYLSKFLLNKNKIYLGEASKVSDDPERCLKIEFTGKGLETIGVYCNSDYNLIRNIIMLQNNIRATGNATNLVLCTHSVIEDEIHVSSFASPNFYFSASQYENNNFFSITQQLVYKRKMMLAADDDIFRGFKTRDEVSDECFDKFLGKGCEFDTPLNRERFAKYWALLRADAQIRAGLKISTRSSSEEPDVFVPVIKTVFQMCKSYGVLDIRVTLDKMPIIYAWAIGLDYIVGIGRSNKSKFCEELGSTMTDSSTVNIRYLVFSTSFVDMKSISEAVRWFILDGLSQSQITQIKCDSYPDTVRPCLSVLYDTNLKTDGCSKFKKMLRAGEILSA